MTNAEKIIKTKLGLLKLAETLGNVSQPGMQNDGLLKRQLLSFQGIVR